jgi:membrane associated rhomboid family serine protease
MGIYDRQYTQAPQGPNFMSRMMSVTGWLIIINVTIYVLQLFLNYSPGLRETTGLPMLDRMVTIKETTTPATKTDVDRTYLELGPAASPSGPPSLIPADKDTPLKHRIGANVGRLIVDKNTSPPTIIGAAYYEVRDALFTLGHFSTYMGFQRLEVWRLITFQFLHGSILHIAFNMLGLWMFGRIVEDHLGRKKYLAFYLLCGICGGLMYLILNGLGALFASQGWPMIPGLLNNSTTVPLVGASAGVFGVIMACAFFEPDVRVQLLLPPVPMRMKVFAYCYVGLAIFLVVIQSKNAGGEAAHIGGAIAGYFFSRNSHLLLDFFDIFGDSRKPRTAKAKSAAEKVLRPAKAEFSDKEQALFKEVDRILAKQRAEGVQSLSDAEKETLKKATDLLNRKE